MSPLSRVRLMAMARKEVLHLRRDPRSLLLAFLLPAILVVLFGYAITLDVEDIRTAVLDLDGSSRSRELLDAFEASGYFTVVRRLTRQGEVKEVLDRGEALVVIVLPPDFARDLDGGRSAALQILVDGSDANSATIALGYAQGIVRSFSTDVLLEGAEPSPTIRAETRVVAVIMMVIAALLTSLTIAREWERGTMEQLVSTPVHRFEVVLGKLLPYVAIGVIDVVLVSFIGVLLFDVPFRGSPSLLMILSLAFIVGALGLGMFISAVARSQLLATQLAMILTFLPAFLLSGFMFAIDVMPPALQAITYLIPARYFLVVTRGVFLKGVGVEVLATEGLLMIAFAVLGLFGATRAFRKEIQ